MLNKLKAYFSGTQNSYLCEELLQILFEVIDSVGNPQLWFLFIYNSLLACTEGGVIKNLHY